MRLETAANYLSMPAMGVQEVAGLTFEVAVVSALVALSRWMLAAGRQEALFSLAPAIVASTLAATSISVGVLGL